MRTPRVTESDAVYMQRIRISTTDFLFCRRKNKQTSGKISVSQSVYWHFDERKCWFMHVKVNETNSHVCKANAPSTFGFKILLWASKSMKSCLKQAFLWCYKNALLSLLPKQNLVIIQPLGAPSQAAVFYFSRLYDPELPLWRQNDWLSWLVAEPEKKYVLLSFSYVFPPLTAP